MSTTITVTTFINASVEKIWAALTRPEHVIQYHYSGMSVEPLPHGGYELRKPGQERTFIRAPLVFKIDNKQLVLRFEPAGAMDNESQVEWKIEREFDATKVILRHYNCDDLGIGDDWDRFMNSLKSYLETGRGLRLPVPSDAVRSSWGRTITAS